MKIFSSVASASPDKHLLGWNGTWKQGIRRKPRPRRTSKSGNRKTHHSPSSYVHACTPYTTNESVQSVDSLSLCVSSVYCRYIRSKFMLRIIDNKYKKCALRSRSRSSFRPCSSSLLDSSPRSFSLSSFNISVEIYVSVCVSVRRMAYIHAQCSLNTDDDFSKKNQWKEQKTHEKNKKPGYLFKLNNTWIVLWQAWRSITTRTATATTPSFMTIWWRITSTQI